jgi:hypothetical protein
MKDWYDKNYQPTNLEPDEVIKNRQKRESDRLKKKEEDFWAEIGRRTKFEVEIKRDDTIECSAAAIQVSKPEDIKIHFGG